MVHITGDPTGESVFGDNECGDFVGSTYEVQ